jgi:hypothetical protein
MTKWRKEKTQINENKLENLEEISRCIQTTKIEPRRHYHVNRPIITNDIEAIKKSLPTKMSQGSEGFIPEFDQIFKELTLIILNFSRRKKDMNTINLIL